MKISYKILLFSLFVIVKFIFAQEKMQTESFVFQFEGNELHGIIDIPVGQKAKSIILIVHGHGRTDVVSGNWYYEIRSLFTKLGIACCVWDKAGCGKSEGKYNHNQTVQNSADEVIAAITELERLNVAGISKIGLWGISRAGWICPLVIESYPSIAYWISVSGTDHLESYGYLLESNLKIVGRSKSNIEMLISEWEQGTKIFANGGNPEEALLATQHIRQDSYCTSVLGFTKDIDPEQYLIDQNKFISENHQFDNETGLLIYVQDFEEVLKKIKCPVLALFGENDTQVNWRKTIKLYKATIGENLDSKLTIKTFPNCNHSMQKCKTGAYKEDLSEFGWMVCDGYYDTMEDWIISNKF